jgi:hypothetical protein
MKQIVRFLFLAGMIALGVWAWGVFFPDPQRVIEKRLLKLARLVSFSPQEGDLRRAAKIERMGGFFAENVQAAIDVPGEGIHTFEHRDELMQAAMASRTVANGIQAEFVGINVMLDPDQAGAAADLTLKARIGGQSELIVQQLKFTFKKMDDDWLITRIETVKALR